MQEIIVGIFIAVFMVSIVFAISAVIAADRADKRSGDD